MNTAADTNSQSTKMQKGARAALKQCLQTTSKDNVVVITDIETQEVGDVLVQEAKKITTNVLKLVIEDYIKRPATTLPPKMSQKIAEFAPTVSIYAATAQHGELPVFRRPLVDDILFSKHKCRHAHMVGINKLLMEDGMNKDYEKVYRVTHAVYERAQKAEKIIVTDPYGTNITYTLDPKNIKWLPSDGKIKMDKWQNLPSGETYTCPLSADGIVVAWVLGDTLKHYGVLQDPLTVKIEKGYITDVYCKNKQIENDFKHYVSEYENGNRVGELGIGTLVGLEGFVGNLLQDEKYPGMHVAFGHPYPAETGVAWDAPSHIDIIAKDTTINFITNGNEELIMQDGVFIEEILNA